MISNFTILTIPQWFIFAAVTVIIYGWMEHKKSFGLIGSAVFVLLAVFTGWAILSGMLVPESFIEAAGTIDEEIMLAPDEIPIEGRMLPFYWGITINGLIAVAAFVTEWRNMKAAKALKITICIIGLLMFFGMMSIVKS